MAGRGVHGPAGLPRLKMAAMSAFDRWIQKILPEPLVELRRLPELAHE
jgi:hypothetical protein